VRVGAGHPAGPHGHKATPLLRGTTNQPGAARSDKPTAGAQRHARSGGGGASRMPGSGGKRAEASHLWVGSLAACSWGLAAGEHVCGGGRRAPPICAPPISRMLMEDLAGPPPSQVMSSLHSPDLKEKSEDETRI
jgi:hypothetical protein